MSHIARRTQGAVIYCEHVRPSSGGSNPSWLVRSKVPSSSTRRQGHSSTLSPGRTLSDCLCLAQQTPWLWPSTAVPFTVALCSKRVCQWSARRAQPSSSPRRHLPHSCLLPHCALPSTSVSLSPSRTTCAHPTANLYPLTKHCTPPPEL